MSAFCMHTALLQEFAPESQQLCLNASLLERLAPPLKAVAWVCLVRQQRRENGVLARKCLASEAPRAESCPLLGNNSAIMAMLALKTMGEPNIVPAGNSREFARLGKFYFWTAKTSLIN